MDVRGITKGDGGRWRDSELIRIEGERVRREEVRRVGVGTDDWGGPVSRGHGGATRIGGQVTDP